MPRFDCGDEWAYSIANSLLQSPDGQGFANAVGSLHDFLRTGNESNRRSLMLALHGEIFDALHHFANSVENAPETLRTALYAARKLEYEQTAGGMERMYSNQCSGRVWTRVMDRLKELSACANLAEVDAFWRGLMEAMTGEENGRFYFVYFGAVEAAIACCLSAALEKLPGISETCGRAIALCGFFQRMASSFELNLIANREGRLYIMTPDNIAALHGDEDLALLTDTLERLAKALPLDAFIRFLDAQLPPERLDKGVRAALESVCRELAVRIRRY